MLRSAVIVLLLLIINQSCNTPAKEKTIDLGGNKYVKYTYFPDGQTQSEEQYLKLAAREIPIKLKTFYTNGIVETDYDYNLIGINGSDIHLAEAGYRYYDNGAVYSKTIKYRDTLIGCQEYYYKSGSLHTALLFGGSGRLLFSIHLDKNGRVLKAAGSPLHIWSERLHITTSDTLRMSYTVIQTKQLRSKLILQLVSPKGKKIKNDTITQFERNNYDHGFFTQMRLTTPGKWVFISDIELMDTTNTTIIRDSRADTITVH